MTLEDERKHQIKEIILAHKGKQNAINAREIAQKVGIPDNDTFAGTRGLITKLIEEEDLPIGAMIPDGYYLIANREELREYVHDLNTRAWSTLNRRVLVMLNYRRFYNEDVDFDAGEPHDGE